MLVFSFELNRFLNGKRKLLKKKSYSKSIVIFTSKKYTGISENYRKFLQCA